MCIMPSINMSPQTGFKNNIILLGKENMDNLGPDVMEKLAEAAHKVWMGGKLRDGWKYGPVTNKPNKIHSCLVPYNQLSETDKESDRDMVRGLPKILAAAGYRLMKVGEK